VDMTLYSRMNRLAEIDWPASPAAGSI